MDGGTGRAGPAERCRDACEGRRTRERDNAAAADDRLLGDRAGLPAPSRTGDVQLRRRDRRPCRGSGPRGADLDQRRRRQRALHLRRDRRTVEAARQRPARRGRGARRPGDRDGSADPRLADLDGRAGPSRRRRRAMPDDADAEGSGAPLEGGRAPRRDCGARRDVEIRRAAGSRRRPLRGSLRPRRGRSRLDGPARGDARRAGGDRDRADATRGARATSTSPRAPPARPRA